MYVNSLSLQHYNELVMQCHIHYLNNSVIRVQIRGYWAIGNNTCHLDDTTIKNKILKYSLLDETIAKKRWSYI